MAFKNEVSAEEALLRLKRGNEVYLCAESNPGDISPGLRHKTAKEGQFPYAVVITCSDSRVIPESIFSAGIGALFVIRTAGNVVGAFELGSIEYAAASLGVRFILVMGHTHCGAVCAAMQADAGSGYLGQITDEIRGAIRAETDDYKACVLNVRHSMARITQMLGLSDSPPTVMGAICHIDDGHVEFLD